MYIPITEGGHGYNVEIDREPNHCPFCHHTIIPDKRIQGGNLTLDNLEILYICTNVDCKKIFIAYFYELRDGVIRSSRIFNFSHTSVGNFIGKIFDPIIIDISLTFTEIYNQSLRAEVFEMEQIAGMGFRKSIEFLIKDYLILKKPELEDNIKKAHLTSCIKSYVDHDKIKEIATLATWLGNDETHYTRRWEDKDINDLKKLIDITLHWMVMEQQTESYIKSMSEQKL